MTSRAFGAEIWLAPTVGTSQWDNQKADQATGINLGATLPFAIGQGWWARPKLEAKQWVATFNSSTSERKTLFNMESRMIGGGLVLSRRIFADDPESSEIYASLITGKSSTRAVRQESTPESFASSAYKGISGNFTEYEGGMMAPLSDTVRWIVGMSYQQFWSNWDKSRLREDSMVAVPSGLALDQKKASLVDTGDRPALSPLIKSTYLKFGISLTL